MNPPEKLRLLQLRKQILSDSKEIGKVSLQRKEDVNVWISLRMQFAFSVFVRGD